MSVESPLVGPSEQKRQTTGGLSRSSRHYCDRRVGNVGPMFPARLFSFACCKIEQLYQNDTRLSSSPESSERPNKANFKNFAAHRRIVRVELRSLLPLTIFLRTCAGAGIKPATQIELLTDRSKTVGEWEFLTRLSIRKIAARLQN